MNSHTQGTVALSMQKRGHKAETYFCRKEFHQIHKRGSYDQHRNHIVVVPNINFRSWNKYINICLGETTNKLHIIYYSSK